MPDNSAGRSPCAPLASANGALPPAKAEETRGKKRAFNSCPAAALLSACHLEDVPRHFHTMSMTQDVEWTQWRSGMKFKIQMRYKKGRVVTRCDPRGRSDSPIPD